MQSERQRAARREAFEGKVVRLQKGTIRIIHDLSGRGREREEADDYAEHWAVDSSVGTLGAFSRGGPQLRATWFQIGVRPAPFGEGVSGLGRPGVPVVCSQAPGT